MHFPGAGGTQLRPPWSPHAWGLQQVPVRGWGSWSSWCCYHRAQGAGGSLSISCPLPCPHEAAPLAFRHPNSSPLEAGSIRAHFVPPQFSNFPLKSEHTEVSQSMQELFLSVNVFSPGIPITQGGFGDPINNSRGDPVKMALSGWLGPACLHQSRSYS